MENDELLDKVLSSIVSLSRRKTTESHAVYVMDSVIEKLKQRHPFLEHIEIQDTTYLEEGKSITIMREVNSISKHEVARAIYEIISTMNTSLGKDAGYFFLKELSRMMGDMYMSEMKNIGVDLNLMQLEKQVKEMEQTIMKKKK